MRSQRRLRRAEDTHTLLRALALAAPTSRLLASLTMHSVLHIIVDDLRPELGAYGLPDRHTPNLDRLAHGGTVFDRAYAQQAVCGPSRNSFLTGRRPDRSRSWNFINHFREDHPEWTTLPGLFLAAGGEEEAGQRRPLRVVLSEVVDEVPRATAIRAAAREEGVSARAAHGLLRVRAVEDRAAVREPVEVWRVPVGQAVRAELGTEVVDDDVEHGVHGERGQQAGRRRRESESAQESVRVLSTPEAPL